LHVCAEVECRASETRPSPAVSLLQERYSGSMETDHRAPGAYGAAGIRSRWLAMRAAGGLQVGQAAEDQSILDVRHIPRVPERTVDVPQRRLQVTCYGVAFTAPGRDKG
jgi:hypothetical protein